MLMLEDKTSPDWSVNEACDWFIVWLREVPPPDLLTEIPNSSSPPNYFLYVRSTGFLWRDGAELVKESLFLTKRWS